MDGASSSAVVSPGEDEEQKHAGTYKLLSIEVILS